MEVIMKALYQFLRHKNERHPAALLHNKEFSSWRIFRSLLILVLVSTGCIPNKPTPTSTPGPPANVNGQAVLGWGGNSSGQIGDGSTLQKLNPSLVTLKNIQAIAAGGDYSMALTSDGRVLEWGGGITTPTEVSGLVGVKQIAAGERHRLALKQDGTVWAWGDNNRGQIGDGTNTNRPSPVQVTGLANMVTIAGGGDHSLAIKSDLSVWSWGANDKGQVGNGGMADQLTPVQVQGVQAIEVAASTSHSVALTSDLKVMGWGSNSECQLGVDPRSSPFDPIVCSDHPTPTVITQQSSPYPSSNGHAIAATSAMTLVVFSDGSVFGFGGHGDPIQNQFRGMCNTDLVLGGAVIYLQSPVKEVTAGRNFALFLTNAGTVMSLGANPAGQLGLGTTSVQECPQTVSSNTMRGVSQLAAGGEHSLALIKGIVGFNPPTVDFGNQPVGTSSATPFDITTTNTGLAPVTIYDIAVSPVGEYSFTENCPDTSGVLAAGASCTIKVSFSPTTSGQRNGSLTVVDDGQGSPQQVSLTGIGTEPKITFSPTMVDFGSQASGTASAAQIITVRNDGTAPLLITAIKTTAGFSVASDTCPRAPSSLAIQGTCIVDITFNPTSAQSWVGELQVDYETAKTASMQLKGTGN
jgi:alpha-tubulin suppressor-like RCC1 family protein